MSCSFSAVKDEQKLHPKSKSKLQIKKKNCPKNSNFEMLQETLHATHLLNLLDSMYKYEMDPTRTVDATERTQNVERTDRPPQQLRCAWGIAIYNVDGSAHNCYNSSALVVELLQSCNKPPPHPIEYKLFCHALLCCGKIITLWDSWEIYTLVLQGCFTGTGAIVWLPQCQWSKPEG